MNIGVAAEFAAAVRTVHGAPRPLVYPARAMQAWRHRKPLELKVTVDQRPVCLPDATVQLALVNAPRVGGRIGLAVPGATMDDGLLYLLAIGDRGLARWLTTTTLRTFLPQARRSLDDAYAAVMIMPGRTFEISATTPVAVTLDGETAGHTPIAAWVEPRACTIAAPPPRQPHAGFPSPSGCTGSDETLIRPSGAGRAQVVT